MKRFFVIPTEMILKRHHHWGEILHDFEWSWETLIMQLIMPFLDEILRAGIAVLQDSDVTDPSYVGEIVFDALVELLTGGDYKENDPFPPEAFRDAYALMHSELQIITAELLVEIKRYSLLMLSYRVENHFLTTITYERMIGHDITLAICYIPSNQSHLLFQR